MNNKRIYFSQNRQKIFHILMQNKLIILSKLNKKMKMWHHNKMKYQDVIAKDQNVYNFIVNVSRIKDIVAIIASAQIAEIMIKI